MVQPIKTKKVEELRDLLRDAKSVILNDFTGLNVEDISELRRICRESGVAYLVIKNTLAKRSFEELGLDEVGALLEGPTAVAVSDNKGGYVAGRLFNAEEIGRLASLPGKEVLLGQVVGTFQAPIRGLLRCLSASMRDLVCVLKAVEEKKGAA